jgi:hypothetical protein
MKYKILIPPVNDQWEFIELEPKDAISLLGMGYLEVVEEELIPPTPPTPPVPPTPPTDKQPTTKKAKDPTKEGDTEN